MNELQREGAQPNKQVKFVPIWVGSLRSGLVTNRSPLIGSTAPRLMEKFYGTSGDLFIDGSNTEISSRFSLVRRPGNSVYNGGSFTGVDSFYEFRLENGTIKVMADTTSSVIDITGSNNILVLNKAVSAGESYFQSVLDTLFIGDGAEQKKWAYTSNTWSANTSFTPALAYSAGNEVQSGYTLIDSNNNLQVLTTAGTSGSSTPSWSTSFGGTTTDGTAIWTCYGSPIQNWGLVAPSNAPSPVNATMNNSPYPNWAANTFYGPKLQIVNADGFAQLLTTAGVTGGSEPTWNNTTGGTTTDGSAVWTCQGSANWVANTAFPQNSIVSVNYTITVQVPTFDQDFSDFPRNAGRNGYTNVVFHYSDCFLAQTGGTSGPTTPSWQPGVGSVVNDGTVVWKNLGPKITWSIIGAGATVSTATQILDSNGNIQVAQSIGKSGANAPAWNTTQGANTTDSGLFWMNMGPLAAGSTGAAGTGTWMYGYAYKNSIADTVSSCSDQSTPILLAANSYVSVQGSGCSDRQCDTIIIFRTTQGGADLWWLAEIPNPGANKTWTYADTNPDSALDQDIAAPISDVNDPPPSGLVHLTYHLNRVWGNVGNVVYYSNPLTTTLGAGTEQFDPSNYFVFPSVVTRLEPVSSGLMVFTTSDIYMIGGQGTSSSILYAYPFIPGIGLLSYNCLTKSGNTFYLLTSSRKVISLDPSSGYTEPGYLIGDKLSNFDPTSSYITWHDGGTSDMALFVSDGATGWYRLTLNPNASVEAPVIWSPFATIVGGCKAVQSVETSPGVKQLLVGPSGTGAILKRDFTSWMDNGKTYKANATIGSIVLANPGQMALVSFIATDSVNIAGSTKPAIGLIFNEALPYYNGTFRPLPQAVNDPPKLAASTSLFSNRYYTNQSKIPTLCRHLQVQVSWPAENYQNELLTISLYGALWSEK